jgi:hypothetical protein
LQTEHNVSDGRHGEDEWFQPEASSTGGNACQIIRSESDVFFHPFFCTFCCVIECEPRNQPGVAPGLSLLGAFFVHAGIGMVDMAGMGGVGMGGRSVR